MRWAQYLSEKVDEALNGQVGISDKPPQGSTIKLTMIGNAQQCVDTRLHVDMVTPGLPGKAPSASFECSHGLLSADDRQLRHLYCDRDRLRVGRLGEPKLLLDLEPSLHSLSDVPESFLPGSALADAPLHPRHVSHDPAIFPLFEQHLESHLLYCTVREAYSV
jgi:hypothetical protein